MNKRQQLVRNNKDNVLFADGWAFDINNKIFKYSPFFLEDRYRTKKEIEDLNKKFPTENEYFSKFSIKQDQRQKHLKQISDIKRTNPRKIKNQEIVMYGLFLGGTGLVLASFVQSLSILYSVIGISFVAGGIGVSSNLIKSNKIKKRNIKIIKHKKNLRDMQESEEKLIKNLSMDNSIIDIEKVKEDPLLGTLIEKPISEIENKLSPSFKVVFEKVKQELEDSKQKNIEHRKPMQKRKTLNSNDLF